VHKDAAVPKSCGVVSKKIAGDRNRSGTACLDFGSSSATTPSMLPQDRMVFFGCARMDVYITVVSRGPVVDEQTARRRGGSIQETDVADCEVGIAQGVLHVFDVQASGKATAVDALSIAYDFHRVVFSGKGVWGG
jgi:hypothetical protein